MFNMRYKHIITHYQEAFYAYSAHQGRGGTHKWGVLVAWPTIVSGGHGQPWGHPRKGFDKEFPLRLSMININTVMEIE